MKIDDPELAPGSGAAYDVRGSREDRYAYFMAVANRREGCRILDLGCGTGSLTTALALAGHTVMGVDPNPEFLHHARSKPGADRVAWVRGTSSVLPDDSFDLVLMTGNVAQEAFITDDEWTEMLAHVRRALVTGGTLCFDTRDPAAREWERWGSPEGERERVDEGEGRVVDRWTSVNFVDDVAWFSMSSVVSDGSRALDPRVVELAPGTRWDLATFGYRFRSPDLLRSSVEAAGFVVEELYGGFQQEPVGEASGDIVVVATARG